MCYSGSVKSVTSSFRIPEDLRLRLEETARHMKRGKNWIINRALEEYLNQPLRHGFIEEARRQSRLASSAATDDEQFWLERSDAGGWK
jgi:predicted transcriptional regulator